MKKDQYNYKNILLIYIEIIFMYCLKRNIYSGFFLILYKEINSWKICSVALCCAVLCCAVLCCVLCCAVLCCAVLCCVVLSLLFHFVFCKTRFIPNQSCDY